MHCQPVALAYGILHLLGGSFHVLTMLARMLLSGTAHYKTTDTFKSAFVFSGSQTGWQRKVTSSQAFKGLTSCVRASEISTLLTLSAAQASSSASERANSHKSLKNLRGRTVVLVFSNQGLGNLFNTAIILFLMAVTKQYGPKYNTSEPPASSPRQLAQVGRACLPLIPVDNAAYPGQNFSEGDIGPKRL